MDDRHEHHFSARHGVGRERPTLAPASGANSAGIVVEGALFPTPGSTLLASAGGQQAKTDALWIPDPILHQVSSFHPPRLSQLFNESDKGACRARHTSKPWEGVDINDNRLLPGNQEIN